MSTVAEIKEAIAKLSPEEYCELMVAMRPPLEDDEWDKQMKAMPKPASWISSIAKSSRRNGMVS